jgi:flagellin-specific chaperone FliS
MPVFTAAAPKNDITDAELSRRVAVIKRFKELLEANISQDVRRITAVRNQLSELRSAWAEVAAKSNPETAGKAVTGVNIAG